MKNPVVHFEILGADGDGLRARRGIDRVIHAAAAIV